jgi:hypothetical protein
MITSIYLSSVVITDSPSGWTLQQVGPANYETGRNNIV